MARISVDSLGDLLNCSRFFFVSSVDDYLAAVGRFHCGERFWRRVGGHVNRPVIEPLVPMISDEQALDLEEIG
jgi:hypothetical protein